MLAQLRRKGNRFRAAADGPRGGGGAAAPPGSWGQRRTICPSPSQGELLARVRAMLRRREAFTPEVLRCGDVTLNQATFQLSCGGVSVTLPKLEYRLMEVLMGNQGIYLSSEDLLGEGLGL